jgi:hypothetical protein
MDARLITLLCKKIVAKYKEMKTRCNLAESSQEGCCSKRDSFASDDDDGGDSQTVNCYP